MTRGRGDPKKEAAGKDSAVALSLREVTNLLMMASTLFLLAALTLAAQPDTSPCRHISPDGWRLRFITQLDTPDKLEALRSVKIAASAPMTRMILETEDRCDWFQCGIGVPEKMSIIIGPDTKVIFRSDSVEVVSIKLIFTDYSAMQYWDSQHGEIPLGLSEETGIYAKTGRMEVPGVKSKVRAIAYWVFVMMPAGSGITKSNIKEVRVTGVRVEKEGR